MRRQSPIVLSLLLSVTLLLFYSVSFAAAAPGYSDEFSSTTPQPYWTFTDPLGTSSYSLTVNPGYLRITSPTGNGLSGTSNYNAPRMLQSVTGNFEATTCVTGSFSNSGYRAGLLMWKDTNNYMRIEDWSSSKVQMYGYIGGVVKNLQVNLPSTYDPLCLKLEKTATDIAGYWSSDGTNWNLVQSYTFTASDPVEIGLFVINVGTASFSADFNWFHINPENLSVLPESPIVLALPAAVLAAYAVYRYKPLSGKLRFVH